MAKIKVMSAGAVEGPVSELAPEFTRASGHEVDLPSTPSARTGSGSSAAKRPT